MSWTWTGFQYDPVFRYKDEPSFFQTGRNNAEARFWQLKIHEDVDRRQTKSSIEFGSDGDSVKDHGEVNKESTEDEGSKDGDIEEEDDDVGSMGAPDRDYQYSYGGRDPGQKYFTYTSGRDRSMSVVSTISKNDWRGGSSKDYQYSYGDEVYEDRPRKISERSSVERQQRNSVDRKLETGKGRQSEERKIERPRQSEERYRKSEERQKQSWEKNRETPDREREGERRKQMEKEEQKRRMEREEERQSESGDEVVHKESPDCPDRYKEGHQFKPRQRVNVNRRKQESRARGGG